MDKVYNHREVEEKIYQSWEKAGYFSPKIEKSKKPFSIILPPPNANAPLHFGHAMYVLEDILARYYRMKGCSTLWLPGADHAGFETQFVFEKQLQKEGKSRFDFNRETLYKLIWDFVQKNQRKMEGQLRRLGFSLDWTRKKFTLDADIVKIVYQTFKKMTDDGLIYRGERLVNYCTRCGTSFSDLEVNHKEQKDPLYYLKYGPFVLATVRPETKFGDTAVAVNPKDKRYQKYIGKEIEFETLLGKRKMKIIADLAIDPKFGTGVAKVTPAHDAKDFEIGQRHNLEVIQVIGLNGKLNDKAGKYKGLFIKQARKIIAQDLQEKGLIEKIDQDYTHVIEVCYKCGTTIEPMLLPQWFIKMEPLAKPAIGAIMKDEVKFIPGRFKKTCLQFLENIRDWNISRQIVWGIRIPAWQCLDCQKWTITAGDNPASCSYCQSKKIKQDEDTFDTWFSSAQWPFAALRASHNAEDFNYFYPTTVMETGYDILPWWVARMIMVGLYISGKPSFRDVVLHGLVKDPLGKKMSKSKGNVVDPLEIVEQYGADVVRMALVFGTALGNDQALSYSKFQAMRNFSNKLWNMGRFISINRRQEVKSKKSISELLKLVKHENDKEMVKKVQKLTKETIGDLENYRFNLVAERLYQFTWHEFADKYIEDVKKRADRQSFLILNSLFLILLKLLHPLMPFITEELYQQINRGEKSLAASEFPQI